MTPGDWEGGGNRVESDPVLLKVLLWLCYLSQPVRGGGGLMSTSSSEYSIRAAQAYDNSTMQRMANWFTQRLRLANHDERLTAAVPSRKRWAFQRKK